MKLRAIEKTVVLAGLLSLLAAFPAATFPTLSWRDYFDDNRAKWLVGETDDYKYEVAGGLYRLTGKKSGRSVNRGLDFDREADFRLEVRLRGSSADSSTYVAFIWDLKDWDNYYYFAVSPKGRFGVFRKEKGSLVSLVAWDSGPAPKDAAAFRALAVRKAGLKLLFSIDGKDLASLPYMSYGGTKIGFSFSGAQTLSVDSIVLYQDLKPEGEPAGPSPGAKPSFSTRFEKDSAPWLISSGRLKGRWDAADQRYVLEHGEADRLDWLSEKQDFDPRGNFSIEATLAWLSGDSDTGYGLVLDVDGNLALVFSVAADGHYRIGRYTQDGWKDIVRWTLSPNVLRFETPNSFGVYRRNAKLIFALNGREVFRTNYDNWGSARLGFEASDQMAVRPLALAIYKEPPQEGILAGSCVSGFGAWQYRDGSVYVGNWENRRPNGLGTLYAPGGAAEEGLWKDGSYTSPRPAESRLLYPLQTKSGDLGLVEASGKDPALGLKGLAGADRPVSGPVLYAEGGKIGYIDSSGQRRGPPSLSLLTPFSDGIAIADRGGKHLLLSASGEEWTPADGSLAIVEGRPADSGLIVVQRKEGSTVLFGLMSSAGEVLRAPDLAYIGPFRQGLAPAKTRGGKYGFLDRLGRWRMLPVYKSLEPFSEGLAYYRLDEYSEGYMDATGEDVPVFDFDQASFAPRACSDGLIPFQNADGDLGFLDRGGAVVIMPGVGDDTEGFSEGLAAVRRGQGWGFIDRKGDFAVPATFEAASSFSNGLAAVRKNGAWGYIDAAGTWAIPPNFAEAKAFGPEGLAQVRTTEGYSTWIDRSGRPIWTDGPYLVPLWREDFDDNSRNWPLGENEAYKVALDKGSYRIACKSDAAYLDGVPVPLDRGADYSISVQLAYAGKTQNEAIAFVWDLKDGGNYYSFVLHPQGSFAIGKTRDGAGAPLLGWTQNSAIKRGNASNKLEVRKEGSSLSFYINDRTVKTLAYETCSGTGLGFGCFGGGSLGVDWIWIKQESKR